MGRPAKHSLTIAGHATSVSLEPEFWAAFRDMAARRGLALNALAAQIDAGRSGGDGAEAMGLATAIRLAVLADLTERLAADQARRGPASGAAPS